MCAHSLGSDALGTCFPASVVAFVVLVVDVFAVSTWTERTAIRNTRGSASLNTFNITARGEQTALLPVVVSTVRKSGTVRRRTQKTELAITADGPSPARNMHAFNGSVPASGTERTSLHELHHARSAQSLLSLSQCGVFAAALVVFLRAHDANLESAAASCK
jgi:hypothetical protein